MLALKILGWLLAYCAAILFLANYVGFAADGDNDDIAN